MTDYIFNVKNAPLILEALNFIKERLENCDINETKKEGVIRDIEGTKRAIDAAISSDMLIISYPKQERDGKVRIVRDEHEHFEKMHAAVCRAVEAGIIHGDNLNESYVRVREYKLGLE